IRSGRSPFPGGGRRRSRRAGGPQGEGAAGRTLPGRETARKGGRPVKRGKLGKSGKGGKGGKNAQVPTALVTGSAKRLGRAIALRLAAAGHYVWIHYLSSK